MKTFTFTLLFAILSTSVFATQNKSTLKLRLQSTTSGYLDETTIFFDESIDPMYQSNEDAAKVLNTIAGMPSIYSFTRDNVKCSINGFGFLDTTQVVKIAFKVDVSGNYKITASNIANFDATSVIRLEDRKMGVFTDLRANFYQVQLYKDDTNNGRFFIHVSSPAKFTATSAGCADNDGIINVEFDKSVKWDVVELTDLSNTPIATYHNVTSDDVHFTGLPEGNYNVSFLFGAYSATRIFHVTGNHVVASITTPEEILIKGVEATFNANATHANHYAWDFGEGTTINGIANPSVAYLQAGTFNVSLTASNDFGCTATVQASVSVTTISGIDDQAAKTISVFAQGKNININLNDVVNTNAEVTVYNLLGAAVNTHNFTTQKETVNLDSQPNGYYIVSIRNAGKINTSRVFLSK